MITREQYFTKPRSERQDAHADELLGKVNALLVEFRQATGEPEYIDPDTDTEISGEQGGDGDGGFRTPGSITGALGSSHRQAQGIDPYDPKNKIDDWLDTFETPGGGNTKLEEYDLYREHPSATRGWCHLSTRAPGSRKRTFYP